LALAKQGNDSAEALGQNACFVKNKRTCGHGKQKAYYYV
jgi:hypothetical protein